jgi:mutator protein MutT
VPLVAREVNAAAGAMTGGARSAIVVLAAVIEREGRLLVTRRLDHTHLAGLWEFPGGKCEARETHADCLRRELLEELGVDAIVGDEILVTEHAYPDRTVRLHFRHCTIDDAPQPRLGQQMQWVTREELAHLEFPEADRILIETLSGQRAGGKGQRAEGKGQRAEGKGQS